MKKPGFLNKITIIDILIIICIIGAVGFAIYHMADDDSSNASATSFDYSTNAKILETYLKEFPLDEDELKLLLILLALPKEITFSKDELSSCKELSKYLDNIYKTEELIRPYYLVDDKIKEE